MAWSWTCEHFILSIKSCKLFGKSQNLHDFDTLGLSDQHLMASHKRQKHTCIHLRIILLTKLLTHIKQGLQKYCETAYSRSGVNQMWILKNSKELLEHLKSLNFNNITSIKSFDFSTLYTTIPHDKLKSRLASIIRNSFMFRNGNRRYKYLVFGHEESYLVKEHSDSKHKYSEDDIIKMLEFLVDNIFVVFAGKDFQQIVGIPMGTNCAPLLADIFLYSYEAEFIQSLLSTGVNSWRLGSILHTGTSMMFCP